MTYRFWHVGINVTDMDRTIAFYEKIGFQLEDQGGFTNPQVGEALFVEGGDTQGFLASLPPYVPLSTAASTLSSGEEQFENEVRDLAQDQINGPASMEVVQYVGDVVPYALAVLLAATTEAKGHPAGFVIDVVAGLMLSILDKNFEVDMHSYKCRNRWWYVGTAGSAEGKSPALDP